MGWRGSNPSSTRTSCAARSLGILRLILTRSRVGLNSSRWPAVWYRPLRMCLSMTMCSCSDVAIPTASGLRREEVSDRHAAAQASKRGNSAVASG